MSFNKWLGIKKDSEEAIKSKITGFNYATLVKSTGIYFTHIATRELVASETYFLNKFEDLEHFHDDETLLEVKKTRKIPERVSSPAVLAGSMGKLNLKPSAVIDSLTATEAEFADWFENYERIATASGWSIEVQGIKLPNYLKDTPLAIWQSLKMEDKNDYVITKEAILNELTVPDMLEANFHNRAQKEAELVIEYYFIISK